MASNSASIVSSSADVEAAISDLEAAIKGDYPEITRVFIEAQSWRDHRASLEAGAGAGEH